jgi:transaldolase
MKIFLITAAAQDFRRAAASGLAEGVVTTPSLLRDGASEGSERELLLDLCRVAPLPVCASVTSGAGEDIYHDGRELAKISDQILVQVPLIEEAMTPIRRLRADGVRVIATLVHTATQAVLGAKAGAFMVQLAVSRLDETGYDGTAIVGEVGTIFRSHDVECDVMASDPQHAAQFAQCAHAGADVTAVTPDVLRNLLIHPLTDRGVEQLLREARESHRPRVTV